MMPRSGIFRAAYAGFLCASLLVLLGGCHANAKSDLTPVVLQADWMPEPEQGGFYEAQIKGYYRDAGLDVVIVPGRMDRSPEQQVESGAAQFGLSTSGRILEEDSKGAALIAVAATMQSDPQALMVHANSPVRFFSDLEGHSVAVEPGATWFEYLMRRYRLKDVRKEPPGNSMSKFSADPNCIQQIFLTSEPFYAVQSGVRMRTLLVSDSGYAAYRVFFTSRHYLAAHPDVVRRFVDASVRGWRDYLRDPTEVNTRLERLNPRLRSQEMLFTWRALNNSHFVDGGDPSRIGVMEAARWTELYRQLLQLQILKQPFDPATAYTTQFLAGKSSATANLPRK